MLLTECVGHVLTRRLINYPASFIHQRYLVQLDGGSFKLLVPVEYLTIVANYIRRIKINSSSLIVFPPIV